MYDVILYKNNGFDFFDEIKHGSFDTLAAAFIYAHKHKFKMTVKNVVLYDNNENPIMWSLFVGNDEMSIVKNGPHE